MMRRNINRRTISPEKPSEEDDDQPEVNAASAFHFIHAIHFFAVNNTFELSGVLAGWWGFWV
jgi:hypothetical protein